MHPRWWYEHSYRIYYPTSFFFFSRWVCDQLFPVHVLFQAVCGCHNPHGLLLVYIHLYIYSTAVSYECEAADRLYLYLRLQHVKFRALRSTASAIGNPCSTRTASRSRMRMIQVSENHPRYVVLASHQRAAPPAFKSTVRCVSSDPCCQSSCGMF